MTALETTIDHCEPIVDRHVLEKVRRRLAAVDTGGASSSMAVRTSEPVDVQPLPKRR